MFVATADHDYILARWAFLNNLDVNFYWLALQAVEKYLKAILLLNGAKAKKHGHDVEKLYRAVLRLDPGLSFGSLTKPAAFGGLHWHNSSIEAFLKRLNEMGSPHNRYMLYGYVIRTEDLFKLDQLVWAVRRHCLPFAMTLNRHSGKKIELDWVELRKNSPTEWKHIGAGLPIEKIVDGKETTELQAALLTLNVPFAPHQNHVLTQWRSASANPPLADTFRLLRSEDASPGTRRTAKETLEWVRENVFLGGDDKKVLDEALAAFDGQPTNRWAWPSKLRSWLCRRWH